MKKQCEKKRCAKHSWPSILPKTIGIAFWASLVLVCSLFSLPTAIAVNFTPKNPFFAICIILILFALKSISMVIYGGILYVVSGILFSLPTAIAVNLIGGIIMTSIPFWIGKRFGAKRMDHLVQRNPKLELLRTLPKRTSGSFHSLFQQPALYSLYMRHNDGPSPINNHFHYYGNEHQRCLLSRF